MAFSELFPEHHSDSVWFPEPITRPAELPPLRSDMAGSILVIAEFFFREGNYTRAIQELRGLTDPERAELDPAQEKRALGLLSRAYLLRYRHPEDGRAVLPSLDHALLLARRGYAQEAEDYLRAITRTVHADTNRPALREYLRGVDYCLSLVLRERVREKE